MRLLWMRLSLITLSFVFSNQAYLSAQCVAGDCKDGKGTYVYPSGARYVGSFLNHMANGFGILYFANGDIYEGEWKDHKREGTGKLTSEGSFIYYGEFRDNQFHGEGSLEFANNDAYKGNFVDGTFQGAGVYIKADGERINGPWVAGDPVNPASESSDEPIVEDQHDHCREMAGIDTDIIKDCNKYDCDDETGRYVYRDGTVYTGMFAEGRPSGVGRVDYPNGDVYNGGWEDHAPNGEGVVRYSNGRTYGALWSNGRPVSELEASHPVIKESVDIVEDEAIRIWAVIIGISRYNHMPTLRYTDDDAYHLYAFLKSPEGGAIPDEQINLVIDEQGSRKNIISSLQQTFYKADENDVILLYYSGHGLQGRLIPNDFDGYNNAVKYNEVKKIVEQSNARHKIVITDACHSGSLLAARNVLNYQLSGFYQQLSSAEDGLAFITSSREEEVSLESTGLRHGIFSHFLIEGLRGAADKDGDSIVTISELYSYINIRVRNYTQNAQHPLIFGDYDPEMPIGFVRK